MIPDLSYSVNQWQHIYNISDAESFQWFEVVGLLAYVRTSPRRPDREPPTNYQLEETKRFATSRQLPIIQECPDIGRSGYRFGKRSRPGLWKAIHLVKDNPKLVIVAWDFRRFARDLKTLAEISAYGVPLLSIMPLETPETALHEKRTRLGIEATNNKIGRPRIEPTTLQMIREWRKSGKDLRQIADELTRRKIGNKQWRASTVHYVLKAFCTERGYTRNAARQR